MSRLARLLALAHAVERAVDSGAVRDHAEAARRLGVSRARISQVASLLNLAPELQEAVLLGGRVDLTERRLRRALGQVEWQRQARAISQQLAGIEV